MCHLAPAYPLAIATAEMMALSIMPAITACHTVKPAETKDALSCQLERGTWLIAQKLMYAHRVQSLRLGGKGTRMYSKKAPTLILGTYEDGLECMQKH